jgi:hypothetical protein
MHDQKKWRNEQAQKDKAEKTWNLPKGQRIVVK